MISQLDQQRKSHHFIYLVFLKLFVIRHYKERTFFWLSHLKTQVWYTTCTEQEHPWAGGHLYHTLPLELVSSAVDNTHEWVCPFNFHPGYVCVSERKIEWFWSWVRRRGERQDNHKLSFYSSYPTGSTYLALLTFPELLPYCWPTDRESFHSSLLSKAASQSTANHSSCKYIQHASLSLPPHLFLLASTHA